MEDAAPAQPKPPGLGALGTAGVGLAAPIYLITSLILLNFERRNPEDGMILGFVMLLLFPMWLGLAVFLGAALKRAQLDRAVSAGAWLMFGLSAWASLVAVNLTGARTGWLAAVPLLLPVVILLFGLWALRSTGTAGRQRPALGYAAATLALVGTCAVAQARDWEQQAAGASETEAELARYENEFLEHLRTETRLEGLLPHLLEEPDRQERAIAAIGRLPSRQAEAIRLLEGGRPLSELVQLYAFNLRADAELCRAYRTAFDRLIDGIGEPGGSMEIDQQRENFAWLLSNRCDLSASFTRAAGRLRQLEEGSSWALANELEAMAPATKAPPPNE